MPISLPLPTIAELELDEEWEAPLDEGDRTCYYDDCGELSMGIIRDVFSAFTCRESRLSLALDL